MLVVIKLLVLCCRPTHLSSPAAEEWLRKEVGEILADGAVTAIEIRRC